MALRAVPEHPKFAHLKRELGLSKFQALGLLEALWHFTGKFAIRGNIGKFTDAELEAWVEWEGPAGAAIAALVATRWLERSDDHRLIVHDWHEHADQTTRKQMRRTGLGYVSDMSDQSDGHVESMPSPSRAAIPEKSARAPANREDVAPLVAQIVIAHPRSRLRNWEPSDVPYTESVATLQAVDAEAERGKCSRSEAAMMILGRVEAITQGVPREQWKFIKPVPEFMRLREYRMDSREFLRNGNGEGNGSSKQDRKQPRSAAAERQAQSDQGLRNIAARRYGVGAAPPDAADVQPVSKPIHPRRESGNVSGRMGGDGSAVQPGDVPGRVIEGAA